MDFFNDEEEAMGTVQRHLEHLRRLGLQVDDIGNPNQQLRPMSDLTPSFAQQTPAGFNPPPTFAPRPSFASLPSFAPSQSFAPPSDFAIQPMQAQMPRPLLPALPTTFQAQTAQWGVPGPVNQQALISSIPTGQKDGIFSTIGSDEMARATNSVRMSGYANVGIEPLEYTYLRNLKIPPYKPRASRNEINRRLAEQGMATRPNRMCVPKSESEDSDTLPDRFETSASNSAVEGVLSFIEQTVLALNADHVMFDPFDAEKSKASMLVEKYGQSAALKHIARILLASNFTHKPAEYDPSAEELQELREEMGLESAT